MALDSKSVLIYTNDNQEISYDLFFDNIINSTHENYNWNSNLNQLNSTTEINQIFIKDLNDKLHSIYLNESFMDDNFIK
jgi:hypothetical protein